MKTRISQLFSVFLLLMAFDANANKVDDPLLKAAMDIQMNEEQTAAFQANLQEFMNDLASSTRKLMRRNNETNVEKKILRKRKQLLNSMDEKMAAVLTEEQYPRYEAYRDLLYARMTGAMTGKDKEGTTGFSTMMGSAHQGT